MTERDSSGSGSLWEARDPIEESERVERHVEMLTDMLADDHTELAGSPQVTSVRISFGRFMEDGDMIFAGPEEHLGTLLGVREIDGTPTAIIAGYEVWLHGPLDDRGEPQGSTKVDEADIAEVPIRQMNEIWGAIGRAEDFEALEQREDPSQS
jgi:hypothetical protein